MHETLLVKTSMTEKLLATCLELVFRPVAPQVTKARLAQLVERKALNLVVVGSSPTVGVFCLGKIINVRNPSFAFSFIQHFDLFKEPEQLFCDQVY